MNMKRVAIVGGETHIYQITKLAGSRLEITGAAVREEQADGAKKAFGGFITTDFRELIENTKPDIVAVANENDKKAEVCLVCLDYGADLIVDKPMALSIEDVASLKKKANASSRSILMLFSLRGDPQCIKLHEIVHSGLIGDPVQIYGKMSVEMKAEKRPPWFLDSRRSGGPILDLSIHMVDLVEWVSGRSLVDVTSQEANVSRPEMEHLIDSGSMFFRLDNGGTAFVEHNRLMPAGRGSDYRLHVVGTKGQLDMRIGKYLWVQTESGIEDIALSSLGKPVSVVENWLDAKEKDVEPLVPDRAAFRANEICCIAVSAAKAKKTAGIPGTIQEFRPESSLAEI